MKVVVVGAMTGVMISGAATFAEDAKSSLGITGFPGNEICSIGRIDLSNRPIHEQYEEANHWLGLGYCVSHHRDAELFHDLFDRIDDLERRVETLYDALGDYKAVELFDEDVDTVICGGHTFYMTREEWMESEDLCGTYPSFSRSDHKH